MANSPNLLKDADARIRALTREVGTLREDLRREGKRRERAIAQARQNEEERVSTISKVQELQYANKKLAAELAAAHEAAHATAEHDRRALRSLREGLSVVEMAVAARAQQGTELTAMGFDSLRRLGSSLASEAGLLPPGLELQASVTLAETMEVMSQLEKLLAGQHSDGPVQNSNSSSDPASKLQGFSYNLEKAELQQEITQLRAQVLVLKASAEQAASAAEKAASAASAAGKAAKDSDSCQDQAGSSLEIIQLKGHLEQARQENQRLKAVLSELQGRLHQASSTSSQVHALQHELQQSSMQAEQQISSLQQHLAELMATKNLLDQENASFKSQLAEQQRLLEEQTRRIKSMQGTMSAQHEDVRSALDLLSASHREAMRAARRPTISTHLALPRLQHSVPSFIPSTGSSTLHPSLRSTRPYSSGPTLQSSVTQLSTWQPAGSSALHMNSPAAAGQQAAVPWQLRQPSSMASMHDSAGPRFVQAATEGMPAHVSAPASTAGQVQYAATTAEAQPLGASHWQAERIRIPTEVLPQPRLQASTLGAPISLAAASQSQDSASPGPDLVAASRDAAAAALLAARVAAAAASSVSTSAASANRGNKQVSNRPESSVDDRLQGIIMRQHAAASASGRPGLNVARDSLLQTDGRGHVPGQGMGLSNSNIQQKASGRHTSDAREVDQLRDDMQDLDQEMLQLKAMLKQATTELT